MRYVRFYALLILVLSIFGCGERTPIDLLESINTDLTAPAGEVILPMSEKVWDTFAFSQDLLLESLERGLAQGLPLEDAYQREVERIALLRAAQRALYTRYIDADGIEIVGNEDTPDEYFLRARNIVLMMTSKFPHIREFYRDYFYMILIGNLETDYFQVLLSIPETTPYPNATCVVGGYNMDFQVQDLFHTGDVTYIGYCTAPIYFGKNYPLETLVHELVHALEPEFVKIDPTFHTQLAIANNNAVKRGDWEGPIVSDGDNGSFTDIETGRPTYQPNEYWAYCVERWFYDIGRPFGKYKSEEEFAEQEPILYPYILKFFPKVSLWEIDNPEF